MTEFETIRCQTCGYETREPGHFARHDCIGHLVAHRPEVLRRYKVKDGRLTIEEER